MNISHRAGLLAAIALTVGSLGELYPVKRVTQVPEQSEDEALRLLQKAQEKRDRRAAKRLKDHHEN
jgi:hypothetical protein